jgi:hypothetical protein
MGGRGAEKMESTWIGARWCSIGTRLWIAVTGARDVSEFPIPARHPGIRHGDVQHPEQVSCFDERQIA